MAIEWERIGRAGAALSGQLPQYMQAESLQAERAGRADEERRQKLLQMNRGIIVDLQAGRVDSARTQLEAAKGIVPDSAEVDRVLAMTDQGDIQGALAELSHLDNRAVAMGQLEPMGGGPKIHSVKGGQAIVQDGDRIRAQGIEGYDPELAGPSDARGQFAGNESYVDEAGNYFVATRVADPNTRQTHVALAPVGHSEQQQGAVRPVNSLGLTADQVPGQKRAESEATGQGSGMAARAQETLQLGVDAARSMPIVRRSIELLDMVETGGIDAAALKLKQWTGITSGDEAELTNNLGKAVLSQLRATFGAQFTEREGRTLQEMEANLGKSTQGNKRILRQLAKMNKQKVDQAMKAAASMGDYRTAAEMQDYMELNMGDEEMAEAFGGAPAASNPEIPAAPGAQQQPAQPTGGIRFLGFEGG